MREALKVFALGALALSFVQHGDAAEIEPCAAVYEPAIEGGGPEQVWSVVNGERRVGCILGATDTTGIRQLYLDLQSLPVGSDLAAKRKQLFDRMLAEFDGMPSSVCEGASTACIVGRQVKAIRDVQTLLSAGQPNHASPELSNDTWVVVGANGQIRASSVTLQPYLTDECREGVLKQRCRAAVDLAAKLVRTSEATFQGISAHAKPLIESSEQFLTTRDKEWDSYFNEVSVQYPWELALNSWRFQEETPKEDRARFPRAPEHKFIALHPVPAFEYAQVSDEHSTQAAVVVELVGYERWRWRDGHAVNRIGASLAASFADIPGQDTIGYGVVLHTPVRNFSIGAVWRDGDDDSINLIFNVDIAALINQYENVDVQDFIGPP